MMRSVPIFLILTLTACGAPKGGESCTASVGGKTKQWFQKDMYRSSGGFLEISRFEDADAAFKKSALILRRCTAQFHWAGNELLAFIKENCIKYGLAESFEANLFLNNGYFKIPLKHENTTAVEKYRSEARKALDSSSSQVASSLYLWPMGFEDVAKSSFSESELKASCIGNPLAEVKESACLPFTNMRVERFQVDFSTLTPEQAKFVQKHRKNWAELQSANGSKSIDRWGQYKTGLLELGELSRDIGRSSVLADLVLCQSKKPPTRGLMGQLCKNKDKVLPVLKNHLKIEGRDVWALSERMVKDGKLKKAEDLSEFYRRSFVTKLREVSDIYVSILQGANKGEMEIQSNFFSNNKADVSSYAYLSVKNSNPMLKGHKWNIEKGNFWNQFFPEKSPNFLHCEQSGSTLSLGKIYPLVVITRAICDESLSMGGRPLPQYIEDEPEVVKSPKPAPEKKPNPPNAQDPEPRDLRKAKPPIVTVPRPEEKPSSPPIADSGSPSKTEKSPVVADSGSKSSGEKPTAVEDSGSKTSGEKPVVVADSPAQAHESKDDPEPSDADIVRANPAQGCR